MSSVLRFAIGSVPVERHHSVQFGLPLSTPAAIRLLGKGGESTRNRVDRELDEIADAFDVVLARRLTGLAHARRGAAFVLAESASIAGPVFTTAVTRQ